MSASLQNLFSLVDLSRVECLNEAVGHELSYIFKETLVTDADKYLASDTDEQLLIHIPFTRGVKLHSIIIQAPEECPEGTAAPKYIKLFVNNPTMDFGEASESNGVQSFELSEDQTKEGSSIPLRFVKFQNVRWLTIFVESNQSGEKVTVMKWIKLMGFSGQVMDVANIKKIEEAS